MFVLAQSLAAILSGDKNEQEVLVSRLDAFAELGPTRRQAPPPVGWNQDALRLTTCADLEDDGYATDEAYEELQEALNCDSRLGLSAERLSRAVDFVLVNIMEA